MRTNRLLRLLLALVAAPLLPEAGDEPRANEIPKNAHPTSADLEEFAERGLKRRRDADPSIRGLLRYLRPEDAARVQTCGKAIIRFAHPTRDVDVLVVRRCGNHWCPWCPAIAYGKRIQYQAAKLASIIPDGELRILNLVWTLPPPLQEIVRYDPRGLKAWTLSVRETIARAYGYKAKHAKSAEAFCWSEVGSIRNFHAVGTRGTPFPKWHPHFDMLLPAVRRREGKIIDLPETWPQLYEHTAHEYRRQLRKTFLPIAAARGDRALADYLKTEFPIDWRASTTGEGNNVVVLRGEQAMHRIRYSCRPLWSLGQCALEHDDAGQDVLAYWTHPDPEKAEVVHRVPPAPAFGQLRSLQEWMTGRKARNHMGILGKHAYAPTVALIPGRKVVEERPKRGYKVKGAWARDEAGVFRQADPREVM